MPQLSLSSYVLKEPASQFALFASVIEHFLDVRYVKTISVQHQSSQLEYEAFSYHNAHHVSPFRFCSELAATSTSALFSQHCLVALLQQLKTYWWMLRAQLNNAGSYPFSCCVSWCSWWIVANILRVFVPQFLYYIYCRCPVEGPLPLLSPIKAENTIFFFF